MEPDFIENDNDLDSDKNLHASMNQELYPCMHGIASHEEPDLGRHNGDEELQMDKEEHGLEKLGQDENGPINDKVSEVTELEIEIANIDLEPNLEDLAGKSSIEVDDCGFCSDIGSYKNKSGNNLDSSINFPKLVTSKGHYFHGSAESGHEFEIGTRASISTSEVDTYYAKSRETNLHEEDGIFDDGLQFSCVVENIHFLDEEELMEEHARDKEKHELLSGLDSQRTMRKPCKVITNQTSDMQDSVKGDMVDYSTIKTLQEVVNEDDIDTSVAETPFSSIPDELIVKILSYLNTEELCRHVAPVCRRWRQISKEPTLWRAINFHCRPDMESLNLLWVLRKTPLLQKLVLRGRTNITPAEVAILSEMCPMLIDVDLGFCDNLNGEMINTLVENCKSLKKLNVEGCSKIDHNCIKCMSKCKKLSCLNFSHCFLQDESLIYLADHLLQIVNINLDGISWITDRGVSSLVSKHYSHLVELVLDGAEVTDAAIRNIARCQVLHTLELSFCECLTDDAFTFLKELKSLRELKLRKGSAFSKEGMSEFFKTVTLPHLKCLNLSECTCIDDSVLLEIVKCCGSHLTFLSLCWCWFITDTGLVSIVDHCGKLEILELLGIDKITGMCLWRVPEDIPKLTFLDLRQCNKIVDPLIVDMIRKMPHLKVLNYYGEEFVHQGYPQ